MSTETETESGTQDLDFTMIVRYVSTIALVFFYLMYMPFTLTTAFTAVATFNPVLEWLYYFSLVLGILVPMYFGLGRENMMWIFLGLSIIINSIIVAVQLPNLAGAAGVTMGVGILFFLQPFLETRLSNWDFMKSILQFIIGILLTAAGVLFAWGIYGSFSLDQLLLDTSFNHMMPQFLFLGGGLTVVWGLVLLLYSLFKILANVGGDKLKVIFDDLVKILYTFLILIFLLGITYNVMVYAPSAYLPNPWSSLFSMGGFPSSIEFFREFFAGIFTGVGMLSGMLFLFLYILGVSKIAKKNEE